MSIVLAKPPVEVEVSAEDPKGSGLEFAEIALASYIHQCWDRAKFAKAASYMVLLDDKAMCKNMRCRKRFDISGIKTTAFI